MEILKHRAVHPRDYSEFKDSLCEYQPMGVNIKPYVVEGRLPRGRMPQALHIHYRIKFNARMGLWTIQLDQTLNMLIRDPDWGYLSRDNFNVITHPLDEELTTNFDRTKATAFWFMDDLQGNFPSTHITVSGQDGALSKDQVATERLLIAERQILPWPAIHQFKANFPLPEPSNNHQVI